MSFMNQWILYPHGHSAQTVMNVGIIIVMNVSCMSHNCHCSTRDTRQHRDMNVTPEHGAITHLTNMWSGKTKLCLQLILFYLYMYVFIFQSEGSLFLKELEMKDWKYTAFMVNLQNIHRCVWWDVTSWLSWEHKIRTIRVLQTAALTSRTDL